MEPKDYKESMDRLYAGRRAKYYGTTERVISIGIHPSRVRWFRPTYESYAAKGGRIATFSLTLFGRLLFIDYKSQLKY
jgi:hypothetical protein